MPVTYDPNARFAVQARDASYLRAGDVSLPPVRQARSMVERCVGSYRAAGGTVAVRWSEGVTHACRRAPGPETGQAVAVIKDCIARRPAARPVPA